MWPVVPAAGVLLLESLEVFSHFLNLTIYGCSLQYLKKKRLNVLKWHTIIINELLLAEFNCIVLLIIKIYSSIILFHCIKFARIFLCHSLLSYVV